MSAVVWLENGHGRADSITSAIIPAIGGQYPGDVLQRELQTVGVARRGELNAHGAA
jgi:hypothetical protein